MPDLKTLRKTAEESIEKLGLTSAQIDLILDNQELAKYFSAKENMNTLEKFKLNMD